MDPAITSKGRRHLLKMLAGSPLLAYGSLNPSVLNAMTLGGMQEPGAIPSLDDMFEVMDFKALAEQMVLPEHWAYLATGVDDDKMLQVNRDGFDLYSLRMRRLVDTTDFDMSVEIFGQRFDTPVALCPVAALKGYHTDGAAAAGRAASARGNLQMLSSTGNDELDEVNEAYGEPVWYQNYGYGIGGVNTELIKRVEAAGCPAMVYTLDIIGGRNTVTSARGQGPEGTRAEFCQNCHNDRIAPSAATAAAAPSAPAPARPRAAGGFRRVPQTWDTVKRIKDTTSMNLVLKGIVTGEDAELAVENGADAVMVSNHGGRAGATLRSTIECLPEVAAGVRGRVPIILDSGVRRGTDIFKALALGATIVGIGKPYVWGLAGFGGEGVGAVFDILRRELQIVMRQSGAYTVDLIKSGRHVMDRRTGQRF